MRNKSERGSFTIEAILSLSIFMFAFVTIVSLATIAKVESTTPTHLSRKIYLDINILSLLTFQLIARQMEH